MPLCKIGCGNVDLTCLVVCFDNHFSVKSVNRTYDGLTIIHYNLKVDAVTQI